MFLFSRLTFAISRKFTKDDKFQFEGVPLNPRTLRKVKMTQYVQRKVLSKQHDQFWLFAGREKRQQGSYTIYRQFRVALMFYCQAAILFQGKYTDGRICLSLLIAIYFQNLIQFYKHFPKLFPFYSSNDLAVRRLILIELEVAGFSGQTTRLQNYI